MIIVGRLKPRKVWQPSPRPARGGRAVCRLCASGGQLSRSAKSVRPRPHSNTCYAIHEHFGVPGGPILPTPNTSHTQDSAAAVAAPAPTPLQAFKGLPQRHPKHHPAPSRHPKACRQLLLHQTITTQAHQILDEDCLKHIKLKLHSESQVGGKEPGTGMRAPSTSPL